MPGKDIRPTSDRLRETLFNVLSSSNQGALAGATFVDLFAGTGAVGIEALSRGAGHVAFVEASPKASALIQGNLDALGIAEGYSILRCNVSSGIRKLDGAGTSADIVFIDPPYAEEGLYGATLDMLDRWSGVSSGTVVIAEHAKWFEPGESAGGLLRYRKLVQGDAALSFYRRG